MNHHELLQSPTSTATNVVSQRSTLYAELKHLNYISLHTGSKSECEEKQKELLEDILFDTSIID